MARFISKSRHKNDESEEESGSEDEEGEYLAGEYHDPLKGGKKSTNLVVADSQYVGDWEARHGWRELYQNWRDEIKESNGLGDRKFITRPQHDLKFLLFIAVHPDKNSEIGYIKFCKKTGVVELTNYRAWLSGKSLGIGSTSKIGKAHLAGHHGEGYKVAALALFRENYIVRIKASECSWEFFEAPEGTKDEGELCVQIKRRSPKELQQRKESHAKRVSHGGTRRRKGNIWEDVTFEIGGGKGLPVDEAEFLEWIKLALELYPPLKTVKTKKGSLILDPKFGNKMFLKGILLEGIKHNPKKYQFGYNLSQGEVNRDRQHLTNVKTEGKILAEIWADAIEKDGTLLAAYVKMLQSNPTPADIAMIQDYMSFPTARKVWQHLSSEDSERKIFFYDSRQGEKDVNVIINSLKMEPVKLWPAIWTPLKKFGLVRTPQEQQIHLFHNAPMATDDGKTYSTVLKRALNAALALDPRTSGLTVVFKAADKTQLDLLLSGSRLEIHGMWLDFRASHKRRPCWVSHRVDREESIMDNFSCDHVVSRLYQLVLEELKRQPQLKPDQSSDSDSSLYHRVCESLLQMPMMVTACPGRRSGEVEVSWTDLEGDRMFRIYGVDPICRITLHKESTCSLRRNDLLAPTSPEKDTPPSETIHTALEREVNFSECGCPEQVVMQRIFKAVFTGLSPDEQYFPMISRNEPMAFFGVAPAPVSPAIFFMAPQTSPTHSQKSSSAENVLSAHHKYVRDDFNESGEDIYGVSSTDGTKFMDGDRRHQSPLTRTLADKSDSDLDECGSNFQSRSVPPVNLPPARRRPETVRLRNNDHLRTANETIKNLQGELDKANATIESLRDEVSRLTAENDSLIAQLEGTTQNRQNADLQIQEALTQAEKEIHDARAEIQQYQHESLNRVGAARLSMAAEADGLAKVDSRLESAANSQIEALKIQILDLKQQNLELEEDLRAAEAAYDKQVRLANDTASRRDRISMRGKRAREKDEKDVLIPSKRLKRGIIIKKEDVIDLADEEDDGRGGGEVSFSSSLK